MFNYNISIKSNYLLVGVYKNGIIYTGSYSKINNIESITSNTTGEIFYSITDFLISIYGNDFYSELMSLIIYDENKKYWIPLTQLII
jgi:hypothetical protein